MEVWVLPCGQLILWELMENNVFGLWSWFVLYIILFMITKIVKVNFLLIWRTQSHTFENGDAGILMSLSLALLGSHFTFQRDTWMWKRYWVKLFLVIQKKEYTVLLFKALFMTWQRLFSKGIFFSVIAHLWLLHVAAC